MGENLVLKNILDFWPSFKFKYGKLHIQPSINVTLTAISYLRTHKLLNPQATCIYFLLVWYLNHPIFSTPNHKKEKFINKNLFCKGTLESMPYKNWRHSQIFSSNYFKMINTNFYTFLQTKQQEENVDPTDANYPLFPQEIEIRPITLSPWKILKTLTIDELRDYGKFQVPPEQIDNVLRHMSQDEIYRTNLTIREVLTKVKDLDTNTFHDVIFWKYPDEDNFFMPRCWMENFVKRRRLIVGMVVGMYWSFEDKMFCFSVLEWSEQTNKL